MREDESVALTSTNMLLFVNTAQSLATKKTITVDWAAERSLGETQL